MSLELSFLYPKSHIFQRKLLTMLIVYDAQIALSQIWNKVSYLLREMVKFHAVTLILQPTSVGFESLDSYRFSSS